MRSKSVARIFSAGTSDDLKILKETARKAIQECSNYEIDHRIIWPDGTIRYVHEEAHILRDAVTGRQLKMVGIVRDITERKQREEALRISEERFASAFEYAPIGMALVGTDGRWLKVNRLCAT